MFSHVVIFWTDHEQPHTADELLAGIKKYLEPIPGVAHFSVGKMVPSPREVVDQSYHVALNIVFANKQAHDDYQAHPMHQEFVHAVLKRLCKKVRVYDFE
jgi:Stress responsive A/B Barrel Domain